MIIEASDGSMFVELSSGNFSEPSVDRVEVEYTIAWSMFGYDLRVIGKGFGDGKVWLGTTDAGCPSVIVDENGVKTWTGRSGNGRGDCDTRPVNLLLKVCV